MVQVMQAWLGTVVWAHLSARLFSDFPPLEGGSSKGGFQVGLPPPCPRPLPQRKRAPSAHLLPECMGSLLRTLCFKPSFFLCFFNYVLLIMQL